MAVRALALAAVSAEDAAARRLLGGGASLAFEVAGEAGWLELALGSGPSGATPCVLECAHGLLTLSEPGAVLSLFGECPVVLPAEPGPDDEWFWALFHHTLSPPLRTAFGFLKPVAAPPAPGIACRLEVRVGAACVVSQLGMGAATLLGLLRAAPWQRRAAPMPDHLPLHTPLVLGHLALVAGQLAALRPGDLLLPETPLFDASGRGLIRLGRHGLQVQVQGPAAPLRLTVLALEENAMDIPDDTDITTPQWDDTARYEPDTDALEAVGHPAPGDDAPEDEPAALPEQATPGDAERFEDLPLALTVRCGHLAMTLGELRHLAPGAVLEVQGIAPGAAALFYGERALAHGELVEIDGRLGLQITRMGMAQ